MNRQIKSKFSIIVIGIALIIASCSSQSPGMDEAAFLAAVDTAVAATDAAQAAESKLTQDAMIVFTPTATNAPPATNTAIPDSPTPQQISTETPATQEAPSLDGAAETPKFTLRGPAVQVSVDTNCRSGPGKSYAYLGALVVGDEASIYGLDPSGNPFHSKIFLIRCPLFVLISTCPGQFRNCQ